MTMIAIDVHKRTSTLAYRDPSTATITTRRVHTLRSQVAAALEDLPEPRTVAVEATLYSPPLCRWLQDLGCDVRLVNAQKLHALAKLLPAKTDKADAVLMLELMEGDMLPEAYLASPEVAEQRELSRSHKTMREMSTRLRNLIRGSLARGGMPCEARDLLGKTGRESFAQAVVELPPMAQQVATVYHTLLEHVDLSLHQVDAEIRSQVEAHPIGPELVAQPGKGVLTVLGMLSEIGDIDRFPGTGQLYSYAGLAPRTRDSGDTVGTRYLPQRCNRRLRYWAVLAAQCAARSATPSRAKSTHLRVKRRHGANTAKVAAAREILNDVFYTWQRYVQSQEVTSRAA